MADDGKSGFELWSFDGDKELKMVSDLEIDSGIGGSWPHFLTVYKSKLYFVANDGIHGDELWTYDGKNKPFMIYDLNKGKDGSWPSDLVVFNNKLYFFANENNNERFLYYVHD